MLDIELDSNFDFSFNELGDINIIKDNPNNFILIGLFANKNKDIVLDKDSGSQLHELEQSRLNTDTLNLYRAYSKQALTPLIDNGYIGDLITNVKYDNGTLILEVKFINSKLKGATKYDFKI